MARRLLGDTELLLIMAAAQQEFAQLLTVPQQLQPGKPSHQLLLLLLAHKLLLWWVEAHRLWLLNPDRETLATALTAAAAEGYYGYHMQATELAAAIVMPPGPKGTPEMYLTMAEVRDDC